MGDAAGGISEDLIDIADLLIEYENTINVTRKLLKQVPTSALPRVGWDQVVGMAQGFSSEATRVGKLWTGNVSDIQSLADNMQEYFGLLQRVIILAHGATRDAGSTLGARIRTAVDRFVDVSFDLIREAVFSYDFEEERNEDTILKMIASVWESFDALHRIPTNNVTAIGEAIGQVAFSVESNLRIIKQLNEASSGDSPNEVEDKLFDDVESDVKEPKKGSCDPPEEFEYRAFCTEGSDAKEVEKGSCDSPNEVKDKASGATESGPKSLNLKELKKGSCDAEEMYIAQLTINTVSEILHMLINLSPVVIRLLNKEREGTIPNFVDSLENILKLCKVIESQTEAFLHPDQDLSAIANRSVAPINIYTAIRDMAVIMSRVGGSPHYSPEFSQARSRSVKLLRQLGVLSLKKRQAHKLGVKPS